jgi:hypothetical protein
MLAGASSTSPEDLDYVLGLQISVAWAGEQGGEPARLGWWKTDLVDQEAGGDLFGRLLPRTAAWAGLQAAREAAIRRDLELRRKLAAPDRACTLFHFGFAVDERLRERLVHHKRHGHSPREAIGLRVADRWDKKAFEDFAAAQGTAKTEVIPGARKLKKVAGSLREQAGQLAAALLPLSDAYPLPFVEVATGD